MLETKNDDKIVYNNIIITWLVCTKMFTNNFSYEFIVQNMNYFMEYNEND